MDFVDPVDEMDMNEPGIEPFKRFRWRRVDEETRARHRETVIAPGEIIWPAFLVAGQGVAEEITSMTGVYHYSADMLVEALGPLVERGLTAVLLFGVPATKGIEQAYAADGIVQQAIPCLKAVYPELEIITDVCLCSYTEDGHCHIGDNDATCELLARIAASHADAGADTVAPSDMMDGRVWYIKRALDTGGHRRARIMSYAAKYASHY